MSLDIKLTKKQFENLIKLVNLGNWMVNSYREEDSDDDFNELEEYIFSIAEDNGFEELIEFDPHLDGYYPTTLMEDEIFEIVDEYNNEMFWDELVYRMARRDLIRELGDKDISELDFEERMEKLLPLLEKYETEFEKNGLDNFYLKKTK